MTTPHTIVARRTPVKRRASPADQLAADERRWAWQLVSRMLPRLAADVGKSCPGYAIGALDRTAMEATLLQLVLVTVLARRQPRGKLARLLINARSSSSRQSLKRRKAAENALWPRMQTELFRLGLPGWPTRSASENSPVCWPSWPLSDACLTEVLSAIDAAGFSTCLNAISPGESTDAMHWLGALREALLKGELPPPCEAGGDAPCNWRIERSQSRRRSGGSYFTPRILTRWLARRTLGPIWRAWLHAAKHSKRRVTPLRIIDPAMGTGHFLIAVLEFLTTRLDRLARDEPQHPVLQQVSRGTAAFVLKNCLWGIDCDPVTVAVARAGLWLLAGAPRRAPWVNRLQLGDALTENALASTKFDVVLGNPPYGKPADLDYRRKVSHRFPGCQHNADLTVAFVALARDLTRPGGRVGLVLPKPLTYSAAWRHLRREITSEIVALCDVQCGWREVRLEQVLVVLAPGARRAAFATARANGAHFVRGPRCTAALASRLDTLPAGPSSADWARVERLRCDEQTFGSICRTFRGLPAQRDLLVTGEVPVVGGRDLMPFALRSTSGYLPVAGVPAEHTAGPRLLFQNIVAHITRPRPHIRLIGTFETGPVATLDTVNNVVPRFAGVDLWVVLALLHSRLVNWYVYTFVYNRAVRTMHFDQCFLDKIPLPERLAEHATALADSARRATELTQAWCAAIGYDRTQPRQRQRLEQLVMRDDCPAIDGHASTAFVRLRAELKLAEREIELLAQRAYGIE